MERYVDPERPLRYSYKSINNSLLDKYLLRHWWALAIKAIPPGANANMLSMVGNLGSWFAFILLAGIPWGPAGLRGGAPSWLFFLAAGSIFFYHTLDALDGMQARRTGAAGPLGEFVDHWFDSFNAFLLPLGLILAFPVLPPLLAALLVALFAAADFLTLEAVRKTGILVFDPLSADEGVFLNIALLIAIGATGYDFWARPLPLGLAPIQLVFAFYGISVLAVSLRCLSTTGGLERLAAMLAGLAPLALWTHLASARVGPMGTLFGGLLLGFSASRFSGDLLRERLMGLEYGYFPADLAFLDMLLLASCLVPGASSLQIAAFGWAALTWTLLKLALQFHRAVSRVEEVCGLGLLGPVQGSEGSYFLPAFVARLRARSERRAEALREFLDRRR
ncbi:MAG TPA: CDP-alcohol phosphatidyltransferase family protein [Spirochaetales bacterium]|nr:CDP-alcohol phosphatidyltransferase family protein [Spirochaetales bacterium]HRY56128.1 CDP-alcohol phosphatidyltransferase family protein [Spirochaetia bacterium]HRZ64728.1 CDP-alcohol phosphatidyltransferase family protein [Spirochaetia bacterium]